VIQGSWVSALRQAEGVTLIQTSARDCAWPSGGGLTAKDA
jgi:hypothetical protein